MKIKKNIPLTDKQKIKTSNTKKKILKQLILDNYSKLSKEMKRIYKEELKDVR